MKRSDTVWMEFHVSREARDRYQFDERLFSISGNVIFANFHAARVFAQRMNERRDLVRFPEQAVRAGQINAMGLMDEILHYVVGQYRQQRSPGVMRQALDWLYDSLGQEAVDDALRRFVDDFPPVAVYRGEVTPEVYLESENHWHLPSPDRPGRDADALAGELEPRPFTVPGAVR